MHLFTKFLLTAAVLIAAAPPVHAEVFQWRDEDTKFTMTFPDRWQQSHNQKPDDAITIWAPGGDYASCRMRVKDDRRFVIYPRMLDASVQRLNYSQAFWNDYIGEFDGAVLNGVQDNAGLGLGFAGMADVSFISDAGPRVQKRGLMLATVYNDKAYVFECSADTASYAKWHQPFLSVLHSVQMYKIRHERRNGYYRDFTGDAPMRIHNQRPEDLYIQ